MKKIILIRKLNLADYKLPRGASDPEIRDTQCCIALSYEVILRRALSDVGLKKPYIVESVGRGALKQGRQQQSVIIYIDDMEGFLRILSETLRKDLLALDVRDLDELYRVSSQTFENLAS